MSNFSWNSVPLIRHRRSQFDLSHIVKTSGSVGTLYPFDVQEVYAGDSFKVRTNVVTRLVSTFLRPVVDNLFLDVYHFFVPSRLVYDDFPCVFGENNTSPWANSREYSVPIVYGTGSSVLTSSVMIPSGTVGDYLGLPVGEVTGVVPISVLPFRAFALIYEQWFRDENSIFPMHIQKGDTVQSESFNSESWGPGNYMGKLPKVSKLHDYFTSCLPAPQKGEMAKTPIEFFGESFLPLVVNPNGISSFGGDMDFRVSPALNGTYALGMDFGLSSPRNTAAVQLYKGDEKTSSINIEGTNLAAKIGADSVSNGTLQGALSVGDLRFAVQYQRMLERDARGGTRYTEYLANAFGVSNPDARLQRSEFLGGKRVPISITQVTQTTGEGSDSSPLASVGAFSLSGGKTYYNKGFTEHGYVISCFCIRQFHSYQDGIEKFWTRKTRTDFFDPVFDHLSEQPVFNYEIYARKVPANATVKPLGAFGYNEAWADLRTRPAHITGQMRSPAPGATFDSLDFWHFGDTYSTPPVLGSAFLEETPNYVDRTISVSSASQDQFLLDFYIQNRAYRCLPTYSVPGLVDHG